MTAPSASAAHDARLAWIVGGSLLIAYAAVMLALSGIPMPLPGRELLLVAIWASALLVLALGVRRSGSVVGRRPLGVVALVIAAVMPLVSRLIWAVVPPDLSDPALGVMVGQALAVVDLAALAVATVVIGRAGAVPHRVRWVPLIVLAVCAGVQIAVQIAVAAIPDILAQGNLVALFMAGSLLGTLGILLLGILAVVLAPQNEPVRDEAVQVFPPAS